MKINMRRIYKISLLSAAVLIIVAAILYQTGTFRTGMIPPGEKAVPGSIRPVKLYKLIRSEVPVIYHTVGTVRSRNEIELAPRITARIIRINHRSGDSVKKDELLVQLDDGDLQASVMEAEENLKATDAVLQLARQNYRRQKTLFERQVIPQKTLEEAEQNLKTAFAKDKAVRQAVRQAQANLSYAAIRSPMDGIVSDRLDDPGDLASPGNIIMKVFDPLRLMLYVPLRESLVKTVKPGDKIKFHVESLKHEFTGEVKEMVPAVDPGSRTFMIKMCIVGDTAGLMPGMFGTVKLELGTEKAYIIPASAVTRIGQLEYLTVMKNGQPVKVLIRTVPDAGNPEKLKIVSGIDADTEIVVNEDNEIQEGKGF